MYCYIFWGVILAKVLGVMSIKHFIILAINISLKINLRYILYYLINKMKSKFTIDKTCRRIQRCDILVWKSTLSI